MNILSHRGFWNKPTEKNTLLSFQRSFSNGYGTETDIRDLNGVLVISHDPPQNGCLSLEEFLIHYTSINSYLPLALNIKSDGLHETLSTLLNRYQVSNYFVFDMSVPDTIGYKKMNFFSRQSDYEDKPVFYDLCTGIWLDSFLDDWFSAEVIENHINNNKKICIVSPELHKREYITQWNLIKHFIKKYPEQCFLCTDYPAVAKDFFYG